MGSKRRPLAALAFGMSEAGGLGSAKEAPGAGAGGTALALNVTPRPISAHRPVIVRSRSKSKELQEEARKARL